MKTLDLFTRVAIVALLVAVDPVAVAAQSLTLTLGGAARFAAEHNAASEAAAQRADMAAARRRQQYAALLPAVAGSLGWNTRTFNSAGFGLPAGDPALGPPLFAPGGEVLGPVRLWDMRVSARQRVIDVAAFSRVRAARAAVAAADAEVTYVSQQVAVSAALAYVRALWADAQLAGRETDSALAEELLVMARNQREAGLGTSLDVTRAESQLAAAKALLIEARAERARTQLTVRRALGLPLDVPLTLADSLAGMPTTRSAPSEGASVEHALRARGDVAMVEAQLGAVEQRLSAIQAERLPALVLFADGGTTGTGFGSLLHTYSWGVQVSIPVFDGLSRTARIAEQRAAAGELDARRRDLVQQVQLDVLEAVLGLESAEEQLSASTEQLALAEQELALAGRRFAEGVSGNADVITAQLGLTAARSRLVDARAAFQAARIALAQAEGAVTELP